MRVRPRLRKATAKDAALKTVNKLWLEAQVVVLPRTSPDRVLGVFSLNHQPPDGNTRSPPFDCAALLTRFACVASVYLYRGRDCDQGIEGGRTKESCPQV